MKLGHIGLAAVLALGLYAFWIWDNKVPQVPRGRAGLVLALVAEDDKHNRQVRADFVDKLRQLLHSDQRNTLFHFVDLPEHHARTCQDPQSASRILRLAKGHFLFYGSVRKRRINGEDSHLLSLEGIVRHVPVPEEVSNQISADFRAVIPRRLHFSLDNDALAFEATSEWAELAARYVIGLAAFASGDVWYAEKLFLSVEDRLRAAKGRIPALANIAAQLPARLEALYTAWLTALYHAYYMTRRREFVEALDPVTNKLLQRNPRHHQALLQSAINSFVLRRDLASAKRAIMACRRISSPVWRYGFAFLLAYEGNLRRAREEYYEAFQSRLDDVTVPIQCEEFMHLVLEEEPEQTQLLFFTAQINEFAKHDFAAARRDYEAFLRSDAAARYPQEADIARQSLARLPDA